jgi:hypothetical protein
LNTKEKTCRLSGTLYLPAGYDKVKKKITALIWAYPAEFKDKNSAGRTIKILMNLRCPTTGHLCIG